MDKNSIVTYREYGKIKICLKDIMEAKELNRYKLSKLADVRFEVIDKWYNGQIEKMDLDVLARICFVLKCEVNDIVKHVYE